MSFPLVLLIRPFFFRDLNPCLFEVHSDQLGTYSDSSSASPPLSREPDLGAYPLVYLSLTSFPFHRILFFLCRRTGFFADAISLSK